MISVVLPTYNGEKYIEASVRSVLKQTYTDFELIIVDDCSTDKTKEIIQILAEEDARIKIIHNKVNQKLPRSLNIGFENAKGLYYTWTSDDNLYHVDAFEKMMAKFEDNKEIDIVYALYNLIDDDGNKTGEVTVEQCKVENMYNHDPIGACFLYKSHVHEKLEGYDVTKFLIEDYDFWLRAYRYFKYQLIPEKLYDYRVHGTSLTSNNSQQIEMATVDRIREEMKEIQFTDADYLMAYKRIVPFFYYQRNEVLLKKYAREMKKISKAEYYKLPICIRIGAKYATILGRVYSKFF